MSNFPVLLQAAVSYMSVSYWRGLAVNIKNALRPGDFATKVKQINSQSDLIWMLSFAGPSYLTIRSSVHIILI